MKDPIADSIGQRGPFDEVADHADGVLDRRRVEDRHDVGMLQMDGVAGFSDEPLEIGLRGHHLGSTGS